MDKIPVRQIKEPDFFESFNIRKIETILSGKDTVQELHRHNYFLVFALEKGMGEHIIDFVSYPITDHSIFFMRPGQVHQLTLKKESTGFLLQFGADFYSPREKPANKVFLKVSNKDYCQLSADRFKKTYSILTVIFQEYNERQERYKDSINANLELLFIELVRQSPNPNSISNNNNYSQEKLEEFLGLLHNNITTIKNVAQYADMLHLTQYQLNAITKETLNKTCSELINEHILLEAKRQILATSNQVNQIAYDLGYDDPSYFIRFFKKHTGSSPEAFRQNFK